MDIGICTVSTHYSIDIVDLARWAEEHDFESLFIGEHTHIPVSRKTPYPGGGELPQFYKEYLDPFVGLAAAAAVTENLKLGTSVCLLPEHHPITLAKTVATIDRISKGRFLFGVGAGWNAEEMANHGVEFKERWKLVRETILAMREIWTREEADYHGELIDFDPIWCWPKPLQSDGPPVLLGSAASKWSRERVISFCDGWFPVDGIDNIAENIAAIHTEANRVGRPIDEIDLTIITGELFLGRTCDAEHIQNLIAMGFNRVLLFLNPATPDQQWPELESFLQLRQHFYKK